MTGVVGQGSGYGSIFCTNEPLRAEHVSQEDIWTSIKDTGCNCSVVKVVELADWIHHISCEIIEYGTFTAMLCLVLNEAQFLTVICVPNLFAHSQLLDSESNVVIFIDSQIWFTVLYFRVTISFCIFIRYGHFYHFNFIQKVLGSLFNKWDSDLYISHSSWFDLMVSYRGIWGVICLEISLSRFYC